MEMHEQDKKLGDVPAYKVLLTTFNSSEIIRWPVFQQQYKDEFAVETEVFSGVYVSVHACVCACVFVLFAAGGAQSSHYVHLHSCTNLN
jgi:hypothetical protein